MKRRLSIILSLAMLVGCQSAKPAFDPFLERTTVPPPGTMAPPPVQPYYQPQGTPVAPPITSPITPGVPASPPAVLPYSAPGTSYPQSSVTPQRSSAPAPSVTAQLAQHEAATAAPTEAIDLDAMLAAAKVPPADNIKIPPPLVTPRSARNESPTFRAATESSSATFRGRALPTAQQPDNTHVRVASAEAPVRIQEPLASRPGSGRLLKADTAEPEQFEPVGKVRPLEAPAPEAKQALAATFESKVPLRTTSTPMAPASVEKSEPQQPVATVTPVAAVISAPPSPRGTFSHSPDYRQLQGQLEYSQAKKTWKLRYIPVDQDSDEFGGSVVLGDSDKLNAFEHGDFVVVTGTVNPQETAAHSFAPHFRLDSVQQQ